MDRRTTCALFAGFLVLAAPSIVAAQQWGRGSFPREGVCFFKDPNFNGEYFCAGVGDSFGRVPDDMNDRISSLKVFGHAEVTVFNDQRFGGGSSSFRGNIKNLKNEGWNDRISSIRVHGSNLGGGTDPDRIIRRAYQDILGRDPDPQGMSTYRSNIIDRGWTEQDVREALRNSPEYQTGPARTASADRIINRAYQDILGRQPDPEGLNTYRRNIIERGWDEQDVRTALRRSQERHDVVRGQRTVSDAEAEDIVRRAYQSVLKREPDASGMREYKARILNDRWTEQQVVSALRSSPERHEVVRGQRAISDAEATEMVRRAYQSVLNREPDAGGLRDYKARVMNDHWSEHQLVNALRNSDEYRAKH